MPGQRTPGSGCQVIMSSEIDERISAGEVM